MLLSTSEERAKTACLSFLLLLGVLILGGCQSDSATGPGSGGSVRIEDDRAEVEGYIQSVSAGRLVVYNTTVLVNDITEIKGEHGERMAFADLIVGMWVDVEGIFLDGFVVAERIDVDTRGEALVGTPRAALAAKDTRKT